MVLGGEMNEKVSGVRVVVCKGGNKGVGVSLEVCDVAAA